jgi:hypothetical protein
LGAAFIHEHRRIVVGEDGLGVMLASGSYNLTLLESRVNADRGFEATAFTFGASGMGEYVLEGISDCLDIYL